MVQSSHVPMTLKPWRSRLRAFLSRSGQNLKMGAAWGDQGVLGGRRGSQYEDVRDRIGMRGVAVRLWVPKLPPTKGPRPAPHRDAPGALRALRPALAALQEEARAEEALLPGQCVGRSFFAKRLPSKLSRCPHPELRNGACCAVQPSANLGRTSADKTQKAPLSFWQLFQEWRKPPQNLAKISHREDAAILAQPGS